jgi:hypothetical protein
MMFPAEQVYVEVTLREMGNHAHSLHAHLTQSQRDDLVENFNTKEDSHYVLICSYKVNAAGLNLQEKCRNVHLFTFGTSMAVTDQAIGRVIRIGQRDNVFIFEYRNMGFFHESICARNLQMAIPALFTSLNNDLFRSEGEPCASFDVGGWVIRDSQLCKLDDGEVPQEGDISSPEAIVGAIVNMMENTGVEDST